MATNARNVLHQDEIDALINSVENGRIDAGASGEHAIEKAYPYDLCSHERVVRGRMPTLDMINERFARYLKLAMFNLFRRKIEVEPSVVETVKFSEYTHSLDFPSNINFIRVTPFKGTALIVLAPELLFVLVDAFFGGSGRFRSLFKDREFTPVEMRVVNILLQQIFTDLRKAWEPVYRTDFEYIKSEVNPHFANIVSPSEVVVVSEFRIDMEGNGGTLHITLPYSMLEPVRELLATGVQSDRVEFNENWGKILKEELKDVKVGMTCTLAETTINLRELMSISAGDIIMIDIPTQVVARLEDVPTYRCEYGTSHGHNSVKVVAPVRESTG